MRMLFAPTAPPSPLRDYQCAALEAIASHYSDGVQRQLLSLPTGAGKTKIFTAVPERLGFSHDQLTLAVAHTDELVEQTVAAFEQALPAAWIEVEKASRRALSVASIVVGSVQTLRGRRLRDFFRRFGSRIAMLVIDEAHRSIAASYQELVREFFEHAPRGLLLGVTATPRRSDNVGLDQIYQRIVYHLDIRTAIAQGYLVPIQGFRVGTSTSLEGVASRAGDFAIDQLAARVDTPERNMRIIDAYATKTPGRQAIVFAASVDHARHLAQCFREANVAAEALWGDLPLLERRSRMDAFRQRRLQILTNFALLTEGVDVPATDVIIMSRPTRSGLVYCLDTETEVLTPSGFRRFDEVQQGDSVAAYDTTKGSIQWQPALAKVMRGPYPHERMACLETPSLDLRVTDSHDLLVSSRRNDGTWSAYGFRSAASLVGNGSTYHIPCAGIQPGPGVPLSNDELLFLGLFVSDGWLNPRNGQLSIAQSRHQEHNTIIRDTLWRLSFNHAIRFAKRNTQYKTGSVMVQYVVQRGRVLKQGGGALVRDPDGPSRLDPYLDKALSPLLEDVTPDQLAVFLEGMHIGDGQKQLGQSWTRRSYHICIGGNNPLLAERLQSLCVRKGFKCNVARPRDPHRPLANYVLHIKRGTWRAIAPNGSGRQATMRLEAPHPHELVWCLQTESGTLVTRRHGKVSILGNCQCLGRGLRPHEDIAHLLGPETTSADRVTTIASSAKPHVTLLDVVDASRRHTLVTLPTLFGMPSQLDPAGRRILDVADTFDQLAQVDPEAAKHVASLDEIHSALEEIDLFAVPQLSRELAGATDFAWCETSEGRYRLSLPRYTVARTIRGEPINDFDTRLRSVIAQCRENGADDPKALAYEMLEVDATSVRTHAAALEVRADPLNQYEVWSLCDTQQTKLGATSDLVEALSRAENWVRARHPGALGAISAKAKWRREPTTRKQRLKLKGLGVPKHRIPKNKGDASRLIDRLLSERTQVKEKKQPALLLGSAVQS